MPVRNRPVLQTLAVATSAPLVLGVPSSDLRQPRAPGLEARYANYLEIECSEVEFFLKFGQTQSEGDPLIHTRLVAAPAVAREFARLLTASVEDYERQRRDAEESANG